MRTIVIPISNSKTLRTSVLSVTALAASSAWGSKLGGIGGGSDSRLGVDFLALDTLPVQNATVCLPAPQTAQFSGLQPNTQSIVVNASKFRTVKVGFVVSELETTDEDRILFLVYSPTKSTSPEISTTKYGPKLGLKLADAEILGFYQIPAIFDALPESPKIGHAMSLTSKMTLHVNFDAYEINDMILRDQETIYIQAGMLRVSELQDGQFENMILSEMDELTFVPNDCPADTVESYEADESGRLGKSSP